MEKKPTTTQKRRVLTSNGRTASASKPVGPSSAPTTRSSTSRPSQPSNTTSLTGRRGRRGTGRRTRGDHHANRTIRQRKVKTFHAPNGDAVRVIVLGGLEEVGRNCTLIEYKNDIILIDMGLEFPGEDMPGVDYIIPDMSYLKGKEKNVRGVIITHGHYDHIGAIPHTVPNIGNPPVYALPIAAGIINKRQTDFKGSHVDVKQIAIDSVLQLGVFKVHFVHINHNIPDSAGIVVETPAGTIVHTGDWKYDFHPSGTEHADFQKMARIGSEGTLLLMGDSTNADREGHQTSEKVIGDELERIIEKAEGRVIIGTFASLLSRVKQILEISEKHGRKVAVEGYSMKTNVEIARHLGFIKIKDSTLIPINRANRLRDDNVVVVCTGAQGEKRAALSRIAHDEHRFITIKPTDTLIFSSSVIPGNEYSVQKLKDTFYRKRARVIHKDMMDVHAGGHAKKEDIKLMLALFKPKYYMPIEGHHFLLCENASVAYSMGWEEDNVFVADNGQVIELWTDKQSKKGIARMTKEKVPTNYIFVDGLGVGDVSEVILRDRKALADEGIIVAIVQIDKRGAVQGTPDIVSRGFLQMKQNTELINKAREIVARVSNNDDPQSPIDRDYVRKQIHDELGKFFLQKTERRPMILPVILEV
ncbi:MAG: ribonuclease J [bacterium]|nr:ribonuclease J [bacterium]